MKQSLITVWLGSIWQYCSNMRASLIALTLEQSTIYSRTDKLCLNHVIQALPFNCENVSRNTIDLFVARLETTKTTSRRCYLLIPHWLFLPHNFLFYTKSYKSLLSAFSLLLFSSLPVPISIIIMGADSKTEKRIQELAQEYKKSGDDYTVDNPRALKIHVKRDLTYNEREHRNVVWVL